MMNNQGRAEIAPAKISEGLPEGVPFLVLS